MLAEEGRGAFGDLLADPTAPVEPERCMLGFVGADNGEIALVGESIQGIYAF